jgi:SAM-dependent MidA family methyltransferase
MTQRFRVAMEQALYGPDGFYTRHRPARHFTTSAQSPLFARAIARLITRVDVALGTPDTLNIVDVGAGEGELLAHLMAALPPAVARRARPVAVELTRPEVPDGIVGLLIATEWLDNVPLDLAENGRYLNDAAPLEPADAAWIERWWPSPSGIVEIGRRRDEAWAAVVARLRAGLALAVDYGHLLGTRPEHPTLAGFHDGREVEPRLDGSTDITCHVAMDSAGAATGLEVHLRTQREALKALGVDGARPPLELARSQPAEYLRRLAGASEAATLTDPAGLGAHLWLWHEVGIRLSE